MSRRLVASLLIALVGLTSGARGDDVSTGASGEDKAILEALERLPEEQFTREAAAHLLRRAGFGGAPREIDALHAMGLAGAVDHLVEYDKRPDTLALFQPTLTERPSFRKMREMDQEERKKRFRALRMKDRRQFADLRSWWLEKMAKTSRPLEEKMTLFWHGHFTSSYRDVRNSYHMYLQNQLLRRRATGNFGDLCREIARDPAMLAYLNNRSNRKQHPNENFARELMELFTLGLGNYTEEDIRESARAFTGWTFGGNDFRVRKQWHDAGKKTFLGKTGNLDGDDVIDIILSKKATSEFIAAKIFRYFVHQDPAEEVIRDLGRTLRLSRYELKPLLKRIFLSREFYSDRAVGTRIKGPVVLVVSLLKTAEIEPRFAPIMANMSTPQLGQALFDPPNVKGWPGGREWITTSLLLERYNLCSSLVSSPKELRRRMFAVRKYLRRFIQGQDEKMEPKERNRRMERFKVTDAVILDVKEMTEGLETPGEIVDALVVRFLPVDPGREFKAALVEFLGSGPINQDRLHRLVQLIVSTPEFQLS